MENKALKEYRELYTYVNDETLVKASREYPNLVMELLNSDVNNLTKSLCLVYLGEAGCEKALDLIMSYRTHSGAIVRESVCMALCSLWSNSTGEFEKFYKLIIGLKEGERSPGVLKQIESTLEYMNFMREE